MLWRCYIFLLAVENFAEKRMNGDSLMIGLSKLLGNVTLYGSENFVMTGINRKSYSYKGHSLQIQKFSFAQKASEKTIKKAGETQSW